MIDGEHHGNPTAGDGAPGTGELKTLAQAASLSATKRLPRPDRRAMLASMDAAISQLQLIRSRLVTAENASGNWVADGGKSFESWLSRTTQSGYGPAKKAMPLPKQWGIDLYLKDESTHPTGSLKHRLARSLFLHALCTGQISKGTPIIEASSGSTAVSEAYFARMLGLPFVAVIPRSTSGQKIALIESYGGHCHFVERADQAHDVSCELARESSGRFMDQFTYAEQATDWRGNNSIAASIFEQMVERHPVPDWVVVGAGTGGTSATIGRYIRYRGYPTRLCVVDPQHSVFFDAWKDRDWQRTSSDASQIEGIGRPRVEASFIPSIIDRMARVPDAASIAAMRYLEDQIDRHAGASTGTNLWAALHLVSEMRQAGHQGSIVTLLCDDGKRYEDTYYDNTWLNDHNLDISPFANALSEFTATGCLDVHASPPGIEPSAQHQSS